MTAKRKRCAVLISGRGSNMEALVQAAKAPDYPAEIVLVISDKPEAKGLDTARDHGIPARAISRAPYPSKRAHEKAIQEALDEHEVDIVCLAGFMRLLSGEFLEPWAGRIINIHPSLLPRHKGLDTHARAIETGDTVHGCSVHHVTAGMDEGPVIMQAQVPVLPDDTPDTLAARVLTEEHRIYPLALAELAEELAD
ncbi:phosphoribosylglycinamide formyltransferase [Oricola thermophila]|uniref:Phosphoribosylglycinamide formyltransferase n=1 Tax=Oricola thermophila TaxID=2742145 RepID=A0A6N1VBM9_9HYPH|nr:phosphoribosylglycinamide formyltransferase [Oricola thermophila]QKV18396.1 phosphoribosylglycinamide formyltransferase [Oricola thermophila]